MRFVVDKWRRIGTRLYVALGFAVALTLISAAVGVYYFEQSGNLNDRVRSESVPALEASWEAAREAERLRGIGQGVLTGAAQGSRLAGRWAESLGRLEAALGEASGLPELADQAQAVSDAAYDLAEDIDGLASNGGELADAYGDRRCFACPVGWLGRGGRRLGRRPRLSWSGRCRQATARRWTGCGMSSRPCTTEGIDPALGDLGGGTGVFFVRRQQLALEEARSWAGGVLRCVERGAGEQRSRP